MLNNDVTALKKDIHLVNSSGLAGRFREVAVHLAGHWFSAPDGGKAGHAFLTGVDLTVFSRQDFACRIGIGNHLTPDGDDIDR